MAKPDSGGYRGNEPWLPTVPLGVAGVLTIFGLTGSIATAKVGLALFTLPFLTYVVWALMSRPRSNDPIDVAPRGAVSAPDPALVRFRFTAPPGDPRLFTAVIHGNPSVDFTPTYSALTSMGEAVIEARPYRWGRTVMGGGMLGEYDLSLAWTREQHFAAITVNVRPTITDMRGASGIVAPLGVSGTHVSRRVGEGTDLADIRPFRPGDSRRHVNWKVTARRRELHVTTSYTERDTDVVFLADSTVSTESGNSRLPTSLDITARAIATVSMHYLSLGDRVAVHDLGFGIRPIPFGSGRLQFRRIVDSLATMDQQPDTPARVHQYRDGRPNQLVFLCSPLLSTYAVSEALRLQRLGMQVVLVDVLPEHLGDERYTTWAGAAAWRYKRIQRKSDVEILSSVGIPIVQWRGPQSLTGLLQLLEHQRRAPRMGVAR